MNIAIVLLLVIPVDPVASLCSTHRNCKCTHVSHGKLKASCSHLGLKVSPLFSRMVSEIDLSYNDIQYFPDFRYLPELSWLDLSYNKLVSFKGINSKTSPLGLTSLIFMNVSHNSISLNAKVYFENLFKGMTKLHILDVSNNVGYEHLEYPDKAFGNLVLLHDLYIDIKGEKTLGEGFLNLTNLRVLKFSKAVDTHTCVSIMKGFLQHVPYLKKLDVSNCNLRVIEAGSLSTLRRLTELDISHNKELGWCGFRNVTQDLPYTDIKTFRANHLHEMTSYLSSFLFDGDISPLQNTSLRELYINQNILQSFEVDIFRYLPKSLEKLVAYQNRFSLIFQDVLSYNNFHMKHLVNLKTISVSHGVSNEREIPLYQSPVPIIDQCLYSRLKFARIRNPPCGLLSNKYHEDSHSTKGIDEEHIIPNIQNNDFHHRRGSVSFPSRTTENVLDHKQHYKRAFYGITIPIPPHLNQLTAIDIFGNTSVLEKGHMAIRFSTDSIEILNLRNNGMTNLQASFHNVTNVQILDLSHNQCSNISLNSIHEFVGLKKLFLNDNELSDFCRSEESCHTFTNMSDLQYLDISKNKIAYSYGCLLQRLSNLEVINLSYNRLTNWNVHISHMTNLKLINLSHNEIQYLDTDAINLLKASSSDNLEIDLSGNPFHCLCDSLPFFQWILTSTYIRTDRHGCTLLDSLKKVPIKDAVTRLNYDCPKYISVYLSLSFGFAVVLTIIITILIYKHKWRIRYWYYVSRTDKTKTRSIGGYHRLPEDYKFDAFISYCETEGDFIRNELAHALETEHNLKLCFHERDFIPGCNIAENIVNAIHNSKKVICIITENFIKSTWCMYEFNISITESVVSREGKDIMLLMVMDYIPNKKTPKVIRNTLHQNTYIKVPELIENKKENFWRRVVAGLAK